jgi:hypothetical protein
LSGRPKAGVVTLRGSNINFVYSRMSKRVEMDGRFYDVAIYRPASGGGWHLTVVDGHGRAQVWDQRFVTDWSAFESFRRKVADEGSACFGQTANVVAFPHFGLRRAA